MIDPDKPVVAVYVRHYISPSETFIYRQLHGVSSRFSPIVLTANPSNLDLFPTDPIFVRGKGFLGKVQTRLLNTISGRYTSLTGDQQRFWTNTLETNKVKLIHAHFAPFAMDLLPLARKLSIPMLVTLHGADASVFLNNKKYVQELPGLVDYARIITVSRNMGVRLQAVGIQLSHHDVHYIGVPVEDFCYVRRKPVREKIAAGEPVKFLQVSNFIEVKGHRYTIEAFARYASQQPNTELILAGAGPLRDPMEELCGQMGVRDKVRFTGHVSPDEVVALMSDADAFVLHSVSLADGQMEGLPTVLMEAMATGLPVISTIHSGIPELIDDGADGFLVAERDVDTYFARMMGLSDVAEDIGLAARKKIEQQFNMTIQNEKLMDIYAETIR